MKGEESGLYEMDEKVLFKETLRMYGDCALDAFRSLLKNWRIIPASIAAFVIFIISVVLFGRFGLAGGFLLGIVNIVLLTLYYRWISECVRKNFLSWREYLEFDYALFSSVINTAFILFMGLFVLESLTRGLNLLWFVLCVKLAVFILFNAVPEVIYMRGAPGTMAFASSYEFVRENWIEWFLPLVVFLTPVLVKSPVAVLFMLSSGDPMLPVIKFIQAFAPDFSMGFTSGPAGVILLLFSIAAATWFMIFRGFLFRELETGSRRQRAYISSQR